MKNRFFCALILTLFAISMAIPVLAGINDNKIIVMSLVNQDPDPANAGDILEIRVGVENKGGVAAQNQVIELVPEYPFTLVPGENAVQAVGSIRAFQDGADMKIVKYRLRIDRDATAGRYELKIREYEEGSDTITQRSINIDVKNKESAEVIHIDKTNLVPGKESSLKFTVYNVGSAPLRDLSFYWENADSIILPVGSDNTRYIKYIEIGENADLEYKVVADSNADAGLYKLDLHLSYDDPASDEQKKISTIAGIYVGGGTDFDIAFSESSSTSTSFTVANVGSNPAFSVSVSVPQQQGWRVTGSSSVIIGNLNKGDYTVASFALQQTAARTAAETGANREAEQRETTGRETPTQRTDAQTPLKILVSYTNTMGERESVEKEVAVNAQASTTSLIANTQAGMPAFRGRQQQGFFSKYKWHIAVAVLLAIIVVAFLRYRKAKASNPDYKLKNILKQDYAGKKSRAK